MVHADAEMGMDGTFIANALTAQQLMVGFY